MERKRTVQSIVVLAVGCALSLGLALAKLLVGLSCNSLVIMLDSMNSFFDIGTGVVSVAAFCMLFAAANPKHPFGWGRSEYLAAFVTAAVSVVMGVTFLLRSLTRLSMPEPVYFGLQNCILICVAWVVKVGMTLFYFFAEKRLHSKALRALLLDSVADIGMTTVSVVSFALSSRVSYAVDAWLGLVVSVGVIAFGIRLVWDNARLLVGRGDVSEERETVRQALESCPAVARVDEVQLHDYGYRNKYGYARVVCAGDVTELAVAVPPIRQELAQKGIHIEVVPLL